MSLCKFTYTNIVTPTRVKPNPGYGSLPKSVQESYIFDPKKIESIIPSSKGYDLTFDSGKQITLFFDNHDDGMTWIYNNLMSGECPHNDLY
jgi:hypothetical protein